ncbi:MAG: methylenetetrahydrofolate reductase [Trueperaceae bacterium]
MRVSVELIPRSEEAMREQLDDLAVLRDVGTVNVPDLLRFDLRSWQACTLVRERGLRAVPHLRAIDVDPDGPLPFLDVVDEAGLDELLVVNGDVPVDMSRPTYDTDAIALLRRLRRLRPDLTLYAALDPYRQGIRAEREYAVRKLEAGADGFFTQPFFDLRLAGVWGDVLDDLPATVFWGATSVTSERSARYWTSRNRVVLPRTFEPTLAHGATFAEALLAFAQERGDHVYFMPIRVRASRYLRHLANRFGGDG